MRIWTVRNAAAIALLALAIGGIAALRKHLDIRLASEVRLPDDAINAVCTNDVAHLRVLISETKSLIYARDHQGFTLLHYAAQRGSWESAKILVEAGARLDASDIDGRTPLDWAIDGDCQNVAEFLVSRGAQLNIFRAAALGNTGAVAKYLAGDPRRLGPNEAGVTPLHVAAGHGQTAVVELLLSKGANVEAKTPVRTCFTLHGSAVKFGGETPLHWAAERNRKEAVALLLKHGANVNARDVRGETPLYGTAVNGATDAAAVLLGAGADVQAVTEAGQTILNQMASWGRTDVVGMLLDRHVDPNTKARTGLTALDEAASRGAWDCVGLLLKKGAKPGMGATSLNGLFERAARAHEWDLAKKLLASGAEINARDDKGNLLLHRFSHELMADADVIRFLVANGCDINAIGEHGYTPLRCAVVYHRPEMAAVLLELGATYTIFDVAKIGDAARVARLLESAPQLIASCDDERQMPLHYAAEQGYTNVIAALLDRGAPIEGKDGHGATPLLRAVARQQSAAVSFLIARGANVNARDDYLLTPFLDSVCKPEKRVFEELLKAGADTHAKNRDGETPLDSAAGCGNLSAVQRLYALEDQSRARLVAKSALRKAVQEGRAPVSEWLLGQGVAPDGEALRYAARAGLQRVVELVVSSNTLDINGKSEPGIFWNEVTALHLAAGYGHKQVVEHLIAKGATVETQNGDGETPLHWAAAEGHTDIVQLLASRGGNYDIFAAAVLGDTNCVAALLKANPQQAAATLLSGSTPLRWACSRNQLETAKLLLVAGADAKAKDKFGRTPYALAQGPGKPDHTAIDALLKSYGGHE